MNSTRRVKMEMVSWNIRIRKTPPVLRRVFLIRIFLS
jgi:hypothetical protein